MTVKVERPNAQVPVVGENGALTPHGVIVLQRMADALIEAQAAVEALTARVETLEP